MRTSTAIAATTASGLLYALAFPTTNAHAVAWVALVPWLTALRSGSTRRAVALAWVWALVSAYGLNDWFPRAVSIYYLQPAWVGAAFFVAVTTVTAAPAFVVFALCWRRIARRPAGVAVTLGAAAWVGAELLRARLLGDPGALLGYSQVPVPGLLQIADVAGVYGTSFVLALVNTAVAELWLRRGEGAAKRRAASRGAAIAAAAVAAAAAYGAIRLRQFPASDGGSVPIAVVQANLDLGSQWRPEFYGRNLDAYLRLTARALRRSPTPRIVVWPESALSFFLDDEPRYRAAIAQVLGTSGAELVAGGPRTAGAAAPPFHNTTFLVRGDGEIAAWYDKERLLPFAEYFPWTSAGFLRRQFGRVREFTPGAPRPPLPTGVGPAGVIVCNEALFVEPARARVRDGATFLLALTNDSWVGEPKYAEQASAMAVVRAIEQRRPLVRASTAGPSIIVEPSGRIAHRTATFAAETLHGMIVPRQDRTLYARMGDLFALLCSAVALAASVRSR
jgi:apolipoprotein N-acyltransferase